MDGQRFDLLTRTVATGQSRRKLLLRIGAVLSGAVVTAWSGRTATAQPTCGGDMVACPSRQSSDEFVCTDLQTSPINCGACGTSCVESGLVCIDGGCRECGLGLTTCYISAGYGYCRDLMTDPVNCGACEIACGSGQCVDGRCVSQTCPAGQTDCQGTCVDTATDPDNCGGCAGIGIGGTYCPSRQCVGGVCLTCEEIGLAFCAGQGSGNFCWDLATSPSNCGTCGNRCESGACEGGVCVDPDAPTPAPTPSATASPDCPAGQVTCPRGINDTICVDPTSAAFHCGACGRECFGGDAPGGICVGGICTDCEPGLTACYEYPYGACVDPSSSPSHCGTCGTVCASGTCQNGACVDANSVPSPAATAPSEPNVSEPGSPSIPGGLPTDPTAESALQDQERQPGVAGQDDSVAATQSERCQTMTEREIEALVRRWYEAGRLTSDLGQFDRILADTIVHHPASMPDEMGIEAVTQGRQGFVTGFPDLQYQIEQTIPHDDEVAIRWTAVGTHAGAFQGVAPTGRQVTWTGIDIFRIECGRIAEIWSEADTGARRAQLESSVPATPAVP